MEKSSGLFFTAAIGVKADIDLASVRVAIVPSDKSVRMERRSQRADERNI